MIEETRTTRAGVAPGVGPMLWMGIVVVAIQAAQRPVVLDPVSRRPVEPRAVLSERIDINHDSAATLRAATGIGPVTAQAIVHERQRHGCFRDLDDLRRVRGIGPLTILRARHMLSCRPGRVG